ncbi:MAG TPA: hypothetical protein VI389_04165 [Geobacteraceae bacterium]
MRLMLTVFAMYCLISGGRSWGASSCTEPPKPEMPSATADSREMEQAGTEINTYIKKMGAYRECLLKMVTDADNELALVVEGWNAAVDRLKQRQRGGRQER